MVTTAATLHVETFAAGPLGCNCSILADLSTKRAIVVDPGDLVEVSRRVAALGVSVDAIVHTHTHIDHVGGTHGLQQAFGASAKIHEADRFLYDLLPVQSAMIGCPLPERAEIDGDLRDGTALRFGAFELGVLHTPGHTPGSVCFVLDAPAAAGGMLHAPNVAAAGATTRYLFAGDTLFRGSIGRTDLWGGDAGQIQRSLRDKLLALPDETSVVAGHGEGTTIGRERRSNPFLRVR
jgi:glyoxylase-like metal-dependent hydrolase (beta-lactamase superfamily II)